MPHFAPSDLVQHCLSLSHKKDARPVWVKYSYTAFRFLSPIYHLVQCTVKHVVSGNSKIDKTRISMENGSFIKVESITECSPWSILQYF